MALGVFHPLLNQLNQLLQKSQGLLVAAHQGFLGEVDGRGFVLAVGQPALQGPLEIAVELAAWVGQGWFQSVEAALQRRCRPGLHQAAGLKDQFIGVAEKAEPLDFVAAGGHQLPTLLWFWQHAELMLQQGLKPLPPRPQTQAMFPQENRGVIPIRQAVNDESAHAGSVGVERRSALVK